MQKEQHGDCVVSSVPRIGLHSFSKPTFKNQKTGGFLFCFCSIQSSRAVRTLRCIKLPLKKKTTSFSSFTDECKVGCERFKTENVHKSKDRTHIRMWNWSDIKSYGTSTGRYTLHGKKRSKRGGNKNKGHMMKVPRRCVHGQDLIRCGGCQG